MNPIEAFVLDKADALPIIDNKSDCCGAGISKVYDIMWIGDTRGFCRKCFKECAFKEGLRKEIK